ncbi:Uncharacterised protein [Mycobacteroides abscessus]|nr:Uncharacterised protein [Mycobacteroides abscessus]
MLPPVRDVADVRSVASSVRIVSKCSRRAGLSTSGSASSTASSRRSAAVIPASR